ncbi:hypothetical protein PVAP13_2KG144600 [Panicum virgatum]|uniref:Myb/SANT-like domain-containing protein n=1 Tax=Panicum virgatum TaxID=38727 RepID=A0A8T0W6R3_PANVG|nr:hypothetical protein PVAP13_2KG144600 [Panicum virgatum]
MLSYLANLVVNGTKTSSTYKMVHYNACAKVLQEKYGIVRTGDQIKNHLKTWQKKFHRICDLRGLSAANWDEDTCTITLDVEHYNNHVNDRKADADFSNKPLEHFWEMHTIFGSAMATGKFAKDSSAPLGTEDGGSEDWETEETGKGDRAAIANEDNNGAISSASKTSKIVKTNNSKKTNKRSRTDFDPLVAAINRGSNKIAKEIKEVVKSDNDVPSNLFDNLMALNGSFNETHLSFYYAHLVSQPHIARAFNNLPFHHKLNWVAKHIADNYPG